MGKVSKATKKFQTKHLKHTLDHRKKQKQHAEKTKGRRGNKTAQEKEDAALTKQDQQLLKSSKEEVFKDMSVEDFFAGGFEVPKASQQSKRGNGEKQSKEEDEDEASSSEDEEGMVENMANLAEKDPEFHKYLQENDKALLEFQGTNPLDGISDGGEEDEEDDEAEEEPELEVGKTNKDSSQTVEVDLKMVKKWKKELSAASVSVKLIRNIVSAFKAAVNANKEELVDSYKFAVIDAKAFQELMFVALQYMPAAIVKAHPYKIVRGSRTLPNNGSVNKIATVFKSHAGSMLTMLHDITNTESAVLVLHSLNQILPYFLSHRRVVKEIIKVIVELGATTRDLETQVAAFAFLNNASREFKKSLLDTVLKTTYSSFIKSCRKTNIRTMPLINFQKNSSAELFGIDEVLGYQVGFEYVRQLAVHLRNSITASTKKSARTNPADAYKVVYNWQFCHSLDFWSRVLCAQCNSEKENGKESYLRQLIYPLVQVTIGVIRLIPTAQFFPLRFYLIRSLIRLSQNTGVFIPIYPLLGEILSSTAFSKAPKKKSTLPAFDFDHNIKCNQGYLGTKVFQDGLGEQFVELVCEYFVLYCKSVSFPELTTPAYIGLRRYIKASKNSKFNKQVSNVLEKIKQNSDYILNKRSEIDFGPTNRSEVERFLNDVPWNKTPLGSYVQVQREVREEKAKILRESLEEEDEQEKEHQAASDEEDDDVEMSDE
ncbi:mRNA-binding ribosome synthesis protein NOC2 LALA0_S10e02146g [Lachancea lanzarotensis]|uniref:LALA0S10e02146g1_1 n=1 Tax=Lachancea lanzarotensis TaxID=1245769 RepID=A0A0C7N8A6_9SACH|nr:uncharacterized protein LALA0_S10e02146g [Lachancea lanzarotensis]CEP64095.1 LALA0S10e02146g1_1 [Lachancea lanzarotensis]